MTVDTLRVIKWKATTLQRLQAALILPHEPEPEQAIGVAQALAEALATLELVRRGIDDDGTIDMLAGTYIGVADTWIKEFTNVGRN